MHKNLIKKAYIKGLIGLPANLFYGTGIPACIIFIDKEGAQNRKSIFMIDASKDFIKDGNKRILVKPIKVNHGRVSSICYIFDNKLAYISDVSSIDLRYYNHFKNLKYLIIDCLWLKYHPSHLNLENSLKLIEIFKPKKAILTNLSPVLDYNELKKKLPKNVIPAHDGLTINL